MEICFERNDDESDLVSDQSISLGSVTSERQ